MFEIENDKIGLYLKELITSKYPSIRKFCISYVNKINKNKTEEEKIATEIRQTVNRVSQILNGRKSIQIYDLPIFSDLLGISFEQILSAGKVFKPISDRITNYNISFSKNENEWIEYLNNKENIAFYADEYGKTVIDYAIEFKNFALIKFLINNGYITFASDDEKLGFDDFGASTKLKGRQFVEKNIVNELYQNKTLRTKIILLALENNDYDILEEMKAREFVPQLNAQYYLVNDINFSDYYDEKFISAILNSNIRTIKYFCDEYYVKTKYYNEEILWIFPYINELIKKAVVENSDKAEMLLDMAIKHNEYAHENLKKAVFNALKMIKKDLNIGYNEALEKIFRRFLINKQSNIISLDCNFFQNNIRIMTNIVYVNIKTKNKKIQDKIIKMNEIYFQIVDIKNNLIKIN